MLANTTVKTSYFKALGDERKDVKFSLQEQREQIWQIALKKEKEALMEVLELSIAKQMLDRKAICSRKHCGNFLP